MGKKGFILPLIVLGVLVLTGYFAFQTLSKPPSSKTQEAAKSILKYPGAKNWEISDKKSFCLFSSYKCSPPSHIIFETNDSWSKIYGWYSENLTNYDWITNSQVLTSIPTEIIFTKNPTKDINCQAYLRKYSESLLEKIKRNLKENLYIFTISCPEAQK